MYFVCFSVCLSVFVCLCLPFLIEIAIHQVEFANVILLNKADLVSSAEDIDTIEEVVRRLNPASRVIRTVSSTVSLAEVMGTGEFNLEETSQAAGWLQVNIPVRDQRIVRE